MVRRGSSMQAAAKRHWAPHAVVLALLAGCASKPPPPAPERLPEPPPAPQAPAAAPVTALALFTQQQRAAADAAARQGRWAEAIAACDVLLALHPGDTDAAALHQRAAAAAQAAVADRVPRARLAQQRGELDLAMRLWLEVLALAPRQAEAADALRAIERSRSRRALTASAARAPRDAPPEMAGSANTRNALEHASLLAGQGEIDAAISLLQPLASARQADLAARGLLAELYQRQADRLAPTDRAAAIRALERSLRLQPGNTAAQRQLRQLRNLSGAAAPTAP